MKHQSSLLFIIAPIVLLAFLFIPQDHHPVRLMDIDYSLRQPNYSGGSCVYASMATVLRWQHQYDLADAWIWRFSGGEDSRGLIAKCNQDKIPIKYTTSGDESFLDWCDKDNRGAVIFYYSDHCVNFVGYKDGNALLLDNNHRDKFIAVPKAQFIQNWKAYGGFALTPTYSPTPPRPKI